MRSMFIIAVCAIIGCGGVDVSLFGSSSAASSGSGGGGASAASSSSGASVSSQASSSASSSGSGGLYWKAGVQQNVPAADMAGWSECYAGLYADTGVTQQQILNACPGAKLALGCRPKGTGVLALVAMGDKQDVAFAFQASDITSTHEANGVGWYRTGMQWGFVPAGDQRLGSRDVTGIDPNTPGPDGDKRLCWSADNFGGFAVGYRCGFDCYENHPGFDYSYERVVLAAP